MKFCPECGAKLVSQKFCAECGEDLSKYTAQGGSSASGLGSFDFSALEMEAKNQLLECSGLELQGSVLVKYTGKSRHVVIPPGVTEIFDGAFKCNEVIASVQIPESVKIIGRSAFEGCRYLKTVNLPTTVEEIYPRAFYGCCEMETVAIPDKITQIREYVFAGCCNLKRITIPKGITSIHFNAFQDCNRLNEIYITDIAAWCAISGLGNIMKPSRTNTVYLNDQPLCDLVIPEGVTAVGDCAFLGCSGLTSVRFPKTLNSIGNCAFFGCGMKELDIPKGVTVFGAKAFASCQNLAHLTVAANIPDMYSDHAVFLDCKSIQRLTIRNSVTAIGACAFYGCVGIGNVTIPDSVVSIGVHAFSGCSGLTNMFIPKSVTFIGLGAFYDCTSLTDVTLPFLGESRTAVDEKGVLGYIFGYTTSGSGTKRIVEQYQKQDSIWGQTRNTTYYYYIPESLRSVTVTDVDRINSRAFYYCSQLTKITIPESVTKIGSCAFFGCSGLGEIKIPKAVTAIDNTAYFGCGLTTVTIPASVKTIGDRAYSGNSLTAFRVEERNTNYKSVDGVLYSKDGTQLIQYPSAKTDKNFRIPSSVVSIASGAFSGCTHLIDLTIPKTVEHIESGALGGCSSLINLTVPFVGRNKSASGGTDRFSVIFNGNSLPASLKNIEILGGTCIPASAFSSCKNIRSVIIRDGVTSIGDSAFDWCKGMEYLGIPPTVTSIGDCAFCGCQSLNRLTIPGSVTNVRTPLFVNCESITVETSARVASLIRNGPDREVQLIVV